MIFYRALYGSPVRPIVTENRSFFEWDGLDSCQDFSQATKAAAGFIPKLISLIQLQSRHFQALKLEAVVEWPPDGGPSTAVKEFPPLLVIGRDNLEEVRGFVENGASDLAQIVRLAGENKDVNDALRFLSGGVEPFVDLYKAFEIVRASVGGEENIVKYGLTAKGDLERFKRTANHPLSAGFGARHARMGVEPVNRPMNLTEAHEFVRVLVRNWLNQLLATDQEGTSLRGNTGRSPIDK